MKKHLLLFSGFLISALFAVNLMAHQDSSEIEVETLQKTSKSWDGKPLLSYPEGKPEVTILRITIPPQTKLPLHFHPVINAGLLTKGQLTVFSEEGKILHLEEGDTLIELVDTLHFGHNQSGEPAEIIVFYAGIQGKPITVINEE